MELLRPRPEHPCADHPCDHCYVCDVLGVCCASVSPDQRAQLEANDLAQRERLHLVIVSEAGTVPSLVSLVSADAAQPRLRRSPPAAERVLLPAGVQSVPFNARKEALYVAASRTTR